MADFLCEECGETLAEQGYCAVCERHWLLLEGEPCPKHDLPLGINDTPIDSTRHENVPIDWVTVARFDQATAALGARLRLDSEGIPTFLDGERMGGDAAYQFATGGVKLQVPRALEADARILLSQNWNAADADDDDLDDAWDELGPEPGAKRRAVMKVLILLFLFYPLVQLLIGLVFRR